MMLAYRSAHGKQFPSVLGMKLVAAKIISKLQNFKQKQRRMHITQEMLTAFNDDPNMRKKDHNW